MRRRFVQKVNLQCVLVHSFKSSWKWTAPVYLVVNVVGAQGWMDLVSWLLGSLRYMVSIAVWQNTMITHPAELLTEASHRSAFSHFLLLRALSQCPLSRDLEFEDILLDNFLLQAHSCGIVRAKLSGYRYVTHCPELMSSNAVSNKNFAFCVGGNVCTAPKTVAVSSSCGVGVDIIVLGRVEDEGRPEALEAPKTMVSPERVEPALCWDRAYDNLCNNVGLWHKYSQCEAWNVAG